MNNIFYEIMLAFKDENILLNKNYMFTLNIILVIGSLLYGLVFVIVIIFFLKNLSSEFMLIK